MSKGIFFDDTDKHFCKSNILLSVSNAYEKEKIIGVRAVFLSCFFKRFKQPLRASNFFSYFVFLLF